jgi:aminoglycoside phosphotransferase (APT) family kinase protein
VVAVDITGGALGVPFTVHRWLDGIPLSAHDHDEAKTRRSLRAVGAMLRQLHEIRLPGAGPAEPRPDQATGGASLRGQFDTWDEYLRCRLEDHAEHCASLGVIDASGVAAIRALFTADQPTRNNADRLLHGDPSTPNTIVSERGDVIALVDWEDALVGDPLFELASWASFHPERRWPALFDGYLGRPELPAADRDWFWRYALRIALARTVARSRFGIPDVPGRPPAARRVARALEALGMPGGAAA